MKLGVMQPYFFPYLGYFDLIYQSNQWIVFHTVQYILRGWMNRNRVLHPQQGWQYITVPVKKHVRNTAIQDIELVENQPWREKIPAQLQHYRKKVPFYSQVMALVQDGLQTETTSLSRLNVRCLALVCDYLEIPFRYQFLSGMDLELGSIEAPMSGPCPSLKPCV